MLKNFRLIAAALFFLLTTLLFLDFTGVIHQWFGWLAKIQLIPALLATNVIMITAIVILTLFFGRIYCSVICPLGVLQDGVSHLAGRIKGKKNRFRFVPAKSWLRYGILVLFFIAFVAEVSVFVSVLDPYAAYGRVASNFFSPLYRQGNNLLAFFAEKIDSYSFYSTEVWIKGWITFGVAVITLFTVGFLAWYNGRTYCNTICPVGAFLGFLSRFALLKLTVNREKCTECRRCERNCKASCINVSTMNIDHSRCVGCFNCTKACQSDAIQYTFPKAADKNQNTDKNIPVTIKNNLNSLSRRGIIFLLVTLFFTKTLKAQQKLQGDGGLATIEDKKIPNRKTPIVPPGALGVKNMKTHCTACQLCVSACPNNVLRPSEKLATLMQPEMSFERGYCRLECTECSQVCPAGAIKPITRAEKTAISIGSPVFIKEKCIVNIDKIQCNVCERHCPTGAITRVDSEPNNKNNTLKIPVVNKELCIGCGACEHLCPARPFSAIYIEGNLRHHSS